MRSLRRVSAGGRLSARARQQQQHSVGKQHNGCCGGRQPRPNGIVGFGAQTKEELPDEDVGRDRSHEDGAWSAGQAEDQQKTDDPDEQPGS